MKNLFKTLILVMVFMFTINSSFAFSVGKLEKFLKKSRSFFNRLSKTGGACTR